MHGDVKKRRALTFEDAGMPFSDDEELLTESELARYTKRSRRQLQRDRAERRGIPFLHLEKQVRYRRGDVRAYVAQHFVTARKPHGHTP